MFVYTVLEAKHQKHESVVKGALEMMNDTEGLPAYEKAQGHLILKHVRKGSGIKRPSVGKKNTEPKLDPGASAPGPELKSDPTSAAQILSLPLP